MFMNLTNEEVLNVNGGSWDSAVCAGTGAALMCSAVALVAVVPGANVALGVGCAVGYLCGQTAFLVGIANAL